MSPIFIKTAKFLSIICILVAITMIVDITIPKDSFEVRVKKSENQKVIFDKFKETATNKTYEELKDGQIVIIKVSKIYDEILSIVLPQSNKEIKFPTSDSYFYVFGMVPLLLLTSIIHTKRIKNIDTLYYVVVAFSIILGVISMLLIGKLLLVHAFGVVDKM